MSKPIIYFLTQFVFYVLAGFLISRLYSNHKKNMAAKRKNLINRVVINGEILPKKDTIYD